MIYTLFTVHYRESTNTLVHYHTATTIREVHEIIRRVGYPNVTRINIRDEDLETGYLSVRDLNLIGPPHFFENDMHITEVGWVDPNTFGDPLPLGIQPGTVFEVAREPAEIRWDPAGTWGGGPPVDYTLVERYVQDLNRRPEMAGITANTANTNVDFTRPLARTREQEDRLAILNRESGERPFDAADASEWRALRNMSPYIPDPNDPPLVRRDRVSVRVVRTQGQGPSSEWEVLVRVNGNNVDLPSPQVIRGLLSDEDKRFIPSRTKRYLSTARVMRDSLREGLSPQGLHDALKAWAIATLQQGTEAVSDTNLDDVTSHLLKVQPATLEVGGQIYKLIPAGRVDARPLIARVRRKALAGVTVEATTIRESAGRDARIVVNEATERAAAIRNQVEAERRQAGLRVPQWVIPSGRAHYWDGSHWNVEMRVSTLVTEIRFLVSRWNTILFWNPIRPTGINPEIRYARTEGGKLSVWLRLLTEGRLHLDNVKVRSGHHTSTHISTSRACMELQGLPSRVDSLESLKVLEAALSRGMRVVNLNSPLDSYTAHYHPLFLEQLPPVVIKLFNQEMSINDAYPLLEHRERIPDITWDRAESIIEEARGVFDVNTPVQALPVDPVAPGLNTTTVGEVLEHARRLGLTQPQGREGND